MFYEAEYAKIAQSDPIVLFGYILVLEVMSARDGRWVLEEVVRAHGAKPTAFVKLHSEEDVGHVDKALHALAGVDERQRALVEHNMRQTAYGYGAILAAITKRAGV
jgi:hypothetical protein